MLCLRREKITEKNIGLDPERYQMVFNSQCIVSDHFQIHSNSNHSIDDDALH